MEVLAVTARTAVEAARLAPSAHNSQPARFRIGDGGATVQVTWDERRELPAGDPRRHYLFAGLGASAESLVLGAAGAGRHAHLDASSMAVAFDDDAAPADKQLAKAVGARRTTRLPFRSDAVSGEAIGALTAEAEGFGCSLAVVDGPRAMGRFAELVAEGTARNFADAEVYREFFSWLRLRPGHPDYDRDGLSARALNLGRLQRLAAPVAMTPPAMRLFGYARLHGMLAGTQRRLARRAPAACLLTAASDDRAARFQAGRAMLRVWTRAVALDLRVHPMTAAMDHAETRGALAELFGVAADAPMVVCFRLGYGPLGPPSPKLPLSELLV